MKSPILFVIAISLGLTFAGYAGEYRDLAAQGFRWVLVDGPYACTTQQYLEQITARRTDAAELRVIEEGQCYYLIPGTIVQVLQEDPRRHMSLIRIGSVNRSLWTYTRFVSERPVQDTYGMIEIRTVRQLVFSRAGIRKFNLSRPNRTLTISNENLIH